jgi:hypothetical protein
MLAKERAELSQDPQRELAELAGIYEAQGLTTETARQVARELTAHDAYAAHVHVELGIDPSELTNPGGTQPARPRHRSRSGRCYPSCQSCYPLLSVFRLRSRWCCSPLR